MLVPSGRLCFKHQFLYTHMSWSDFWVGGLWERNCIVEGVLICYPFLNYILFVEVQLLLLDSLILYVTFDVLVLL